MNSVLAPPMFGAQQVTAIMEKLRTPDTKLPSSQAVEIWETVLRTMRQEVASAVFYCCLKESQAVSLENEILVIAANTPYAREWMQYRLKRKIEVTVARILGHPVELHIVLMNGNRSSK